MTFVILLFIILSLDQCIGQVIDIGDVWEIKCPQGCTCEIQKYSDLSLHQWAGINKDNNQDIPSDGADLNINDNSMAHELMKIATCVIVDNPEELLTKLPSDIQVLTLLESGSGDVDILLQATTFQRFTELISLDIQGIDYSDSSMKETNNRTEKGGIILASDTMYPLGSTLLYLNLERIKLSNLNLPNKDKANLVIKPMNSQETETVDENQVSMSNSSQYKGHRLIFLSQQNNEDKEILPYDIYKQELEGYRENVELLAALGVLTHLRIYDCNLKDISWHMFDGLNSLLYLSLEKNGLKFIPEFCFYGTPNLRSLSLASNELLTLKSVDLAGLLLLEHLDLRQNNLTFLSELSFPPFPALVSADFTNNPLDSIFPSTFEIMNTTIKLYLGGMASKLKLQKNSLLGLRRAEILHLYNLEIPILERFIMQGLPSLTHLKMRGNVSRIDFDAFVDLTNLLDLDLSHCHIQQISMDAFYGLEKVRRIDLSNNDLESIPPGLFTAQQQKELRDIILTKNKLTSLSLDFFRNLRLPNKQTRVQNIRLDDNPWDCACIMISWNPNLVNRNKETAPRCSTPKRLQNWGVFYALRKGGLQCRNPRKRYLRKFLKTRNSEEDNNIS
ncbi:PREDICTED: insulin-like growth factor-binding protein complex acid labile subunit [Trachymyrmex cornetzi]|uniref:insulin-like growth factor-binding protein complex acid labile subunit n=1 Tax=Trachymyrmex cornetzi TaxID=471704 RepID=UPI00084F236D|nr:PREDICTED: insulin-like growth factor-binding protein complex acid labile subunit [Trachymyrmex cornetzi]